MDSRRGRVRVDRGRNRPGLPETEAHKQQDDDKDGDRHHQLPAESSPEARGRGELLPRVIVPGMGRFVSRGRGIAGHGGQDVRVLERVQAGQ